MCGAGAYDQLSVSAVVMCLSEWSAPLYLSGALLLPRYFRHSRS
jgi:hypothetical protein